MTTRRGAALAAILLLAGLAHAERATTSFDALESGVAQLQNALPGERDAQQRRASRIYVKVITRLAKDTRSLRAELKRGRQVLPPLARLRDTEVDELVTGAVGALADEIYDTIDAAQQVLDGAPAKRAASRKRVQRLLDIARNHVQRGVAAVKVKKRIAFLLRAEAKARRALELAPGVPPREPDDVGDSCPGRRLGDGETMSFTVDGGPEQVYRSIAFATVQQGETATTTVSFHDCAPANGMQLAVILPAPTPAGSYSQDSSLPESVVRFAVGPSSGDGLTESTSGTAELTSVVGRLQMTFSFVAGGATYTGSVDVEPRP